MSSSTNTRARGYGDLKVETADVLTEFVTPLRGRVTEYMDDPAQLDAILARGAERARSVASATLESVYDKVGVPVTEALTQY